MTPKTCRLTQPTKEGGELMAIFRCVSPNFWTDPKWMTILPRRTNTFTSTSWQILIRPWALLWAWEKAGQPRAGLQRGCRRRLIRRMEIVHGVIRYDKTTKEVLLLNWHKYNWSKSPKCLKGVEYSLKTSKCPRFRQLLYRYPIHTVSIQYGYNCICICNW